MSGKFQKFNFRKFVFKKRKDRRFSQETIPRVNSSEKSGFHRRQLNCSEGDITLRRRGVISVGAGSEARHQDATGNRYEPNFIHPSGPKKGVAINRGLTSVEYFSQLPKRRSKTLEPKSVSMIDEPISYVDSMPRNLKEATWTAANTSPFVYQKSVSSPCVGTKKAATKSTQGFDGLAVGWPSLRTWDVPGPKARFPASVVGPVHVPSSTKITGISMSSNSLTPLSSDSRTAISNRAKKLFALKLITGEIWSPEPASIQYIVDQELSDTSTNRLNTMITNRPATQKVLFQDKAGKSLVDTVKKVVSTHSQPTNHNLKWRLQTNQERNKGNFSKHIRTPNVGTSRAYSDTNNLYLSKLKNSEQTVPRYGKNENQLGKGLKASKVPENIVPISDKVTETVGVNPGTNHKISNVSAASNLRLPKIDQKIIENSSDSTQTLIEKARLNDGWHIKKVSDFVWQKLKKMSDFATSNLRQTSSPTKENLELKVKKAPEVTIQTVQKVPEFTKQAVKSIPDVNITNLNHVTELAGQDLKNITQFARPISKYGYEYLKPIPKYDPEFARPFPKNVPSPARPNFRKMSDPNFAKEKGFAWTSSNVSKFSDPNLKTYEVTETAIKKFPYFEVVNIKKEYDFVLPNVKKEYNFVRPNMSNHRERLQPIMKKESQIVESKPKIAPVVTEPIPTKAHISTAESNRETFIDKESNIEKESSLSELNGNKGSKQAEPRLEKTRLTESKEETLSEPITVKEPNLVEPNLKNEPDLGGKNAEMLPEHSESNVKKVSEFTREEKGKAITVLQPEKTHGLDSTNTEKIPVSVPPLKQAVPNININNASKLSPRSKVGVLSQFPPAMTDKETNSILKALDDTAKSITKTVTGDNLNKISNVPGKIENKPPYSRPQETESSWKIYVVHNAHGKGSNPGSSQQKNINDSIVGTQTPVKPTKFIPDNQVSKTWKKMNSTTHNPPSRSNGCTESLITTRKLKTTNLQNYPPPQMFNRMERGENKFLVFWKGREDTNIFSNPNKKQSFLLTPQSPRKTTSNEGKIQKSSAECEASEDENLSRKKSSDDVKCVKSISCMPSQISSCSEKSSDSVSNFLPVVCVPSETLPCVVVTSNSSSDYQPKNDSAEKI